MPSTLRHMFRKNGAIRKNKNGTLPKSEECACTCKKPDSECTCLRCPPVSLVHTHPFFSPDQSRPSGLYGSNVCKIEIDGTEYVLECVSTDERYVNERFSSGVAWYHPERDKNPDGAYTYHSKEEAADDDECATAYRIESVFYQKKSSEEWARVTFRLEMDAASEEWAISADDCNNEDCGNPTKHRMFRNYLYIRVESYTQSLTATYYVHTKTHWLLTGSSTERAIDGGGLLPFNLWDFTLTPDDPEKEWEDALDGSSSFVKTSDIENIPRPHYGLIGSFACGFNAGCNGVLSYEFCAAPYIGGEGAVRIYGFDYVCEEYPCPCPDSGSSSSSSSSSGGSSGDSSGGDDSSSSSSSPSPSASSPSPSASSPSPSASSPSPSASSPSPSFPSPSSSGGGGGCKLEEAKFSVIAKHKTVGGIFSYTYTMQEEDTPDPLIEYWALSWHGYKGDQYFEPISGDAYYNFCQAGAPEGVSLEVIRQGMQEAANEIYNENINSPWENGGLYLDGREWGPNDSQGEFVIKGKGSYTIPYWAFTGNELYHNTSNPAQCFGEIKLESVTEGVTSVTVRIGGVVEYELAVGETLDWTALEPFYPFGPLPKPVVGSCVWEPEEVPEDRTEWPEIFNASDETYPWGNVGERFDLKIEIVGYSCKKVKSVAPVATDINAYNNALPEDLR